MHRAVLQNGTIIFTHSVTISLLVLIEKIYIFNTGERVKHICLSKYKKMQIIINMIFGARHYMHTCINGVIGLYYEKKSHVEFHHAWSWIHVLTVIGCCSTLCWPHILQAIWFHCARYYNNRSFIIIHRHPSSDYKFIIWRIFEGDLLINWTILARHVPYWYCLFGLYVFCCNSHVIVW